MYRKYERPTRGWKAAAGCGGLVELVEVRDSVQDISRAKGTPDSAMV